MIIAVAAPDLGDQRQRGQPHQAPVRRNAADPDRGAAQARPKNRALAKRFTGGPEDQGAGQGLPRARRGALSVTMDARVGRASSGWPTRSRKGAEKEMAVATVPNSCILDAGPAPAETGGRFAAWE